MILREGDLVLRTLSIHDKEILASLANNKKIWLNVRDSFPHPYSPDDAIGFIEYSKNQYPQLNLGIEYQDALCGVIGLTPQTDVYHKSIEIGYWIGEPYWHKGIATRAVALMKNYALQELNYIRVFAGVFEHNSASMRVLEKNGFLKEGIRRKSIFKDKVFWDEHHYAFVKE